ncbi:MAG TPA: exo-alpha-sialidase, partial [Planctomycetes bacterium]|nr:exo-alpha-sialidase [Planctomycetota bacterium]
VLLEDDKTVLCVYPKGHGKGAIVYKKSQDGGKSWSDRLPTPQNWASSKEVPTIHRVIDGEGTKRLILWSGLYPARLAVSEDDGASWSGLKAAGDWGGIVVMGSVARLADGRYASWFHDDGRFLRSKRGPSRFDVLQTISSDGGLTWSAPISIAHRADVHLCEPGFVRSPDGKTIALLLRENSRTRNSFVIFSKDEGLSWSAPRELPAALTGDRHTAIHTGDGRLFISFRDTTRESVTKGDWVGWVGKWQDIIDGSEGQYRVRLMDNHVGGDCAYPAILQQKDGTIIAITYGHWSPGESPWIACRRFTIDELDLRRAALEE